MKLTNKILFIYLFLLFANTVLAKTVVTSTMYQTDFEDSEEVDNNWELNAGVFGKECVNKWYLGKPGSNGGEKGLYISADSLSNNYENKSVSVVAKRKIILDEGYYELSFDWQAGGFRDVDGLYVCWIPENAGVPINSGNTNILQQFVKDYALRITEDSIRLMQQGWNTIDFQIYADGTPYYLVFVWNNGSSAELQPGACVDNIFIMEHGRCSKPTDLISVSHGETITLSWQGGADAYDVKVYCQMAKEWYYFNGITDKYLEIKGLEEGMKTYYVRSICDTISGPWTSKEAFFFYQRSNCISYLGLSSRNCFYGLFNSPTASTGAIDFGYRSMKSRHTLHYNQDEYDARTQNQLKTVPPGALASVRLGNWDINGEAEGIVYDYLVDTTQASILLLNYAIVMEDPAHERDVQPMFTLDITERGLLLEGDCGKAHFAAGFDMEDESWHKFEAANIGGETTIGGWWKDWTTVGINLDKYHGKSLRIQLVTYDCSLGGHFGYAYFTLSCSHGKIEGLSCGSDTLNSFKAPDGFKYRWYLPDNPDSIISSEQYLNVEQNDTLTYYLDVIQPTNEDCYYTLSASAVSRWPRAFAEYSHSIVDCQNVVTFKNNSYVSRQNQITNIVEKTGEKCESFLWDFGDGTTSTEENPTHIYEHGGTYTVTLSANIATCSSDTTFVIENIPELGEMVDITYATVCNGTPYLFAGEYRFNTGIYSDTVVTKYGCDSIQVLNLFVAEKYDSLIVDTICSTEDYYFDIDADGQKDLITESGEYKAPYKSIYDCDSVIRLNIVVRESLLLDIDTLASVCAGDVSLSIPYQKVSGSLDFCKITLDLKDSVYSVIADVKSQDNVISFALPAGINPGYYNLNLNFGEYTCGGEDKNIPLQVYYPKEVITQRWGDVLAVKNESFNGGYEFVTFQWYKNGQKIDGATSSIFYEQEGLDKTATYSVLLTDANNVSIMSCIVEPIDLSLDDEDLVVVFTSNDNLAVETSKAANLKIWSLNGVLLDERNIGDGLNLIDDFTLKGTYLFEFIFEDAQREIEQVIIK